MTEHTPVDMVWVLLCGILVFMMQAGFMCLEVGLVRQKNSINVAIKNLTDFLISSVTFFLFGFGLMFGTSHAGWVGTDGWLLAKYIPMDETGWLYTFWFFQVVFCGASATIVSGGVAERMRFDGYILVSFFISALVYPIFGHWAWGGAFDMAPSQGWLAAMGYKDFAGSSVVHMVGGVATLACLLVLDPRKGKYNPDGSVNKIWGSDIPLSTLGVFLLWFGWFGFNGGSTLAVNKNIGLIILNTNLAACTGSLSCLFFTWFIYKRPEVEAVLNGSLGGLVAITAPCAFVTPVAALLIGFLAGPVLIVAQLLLDRFRIDDAVGAVPVHGACGMLGVLCVGFFAKPEFLVEGGRLQQIGIQLLGMSVCFVYTFFVTWVGMTAVNKWIKRLRVSPDDEEKGLNISEHGARTLWYELAQQIHDVEKTADLSARVTEEPETEAGMVAAAFNRLVASLEKRTREFKEVHNQMVQSAKMAAVGQLAGGVAHEINNPLAVILGFAQGLVKRLKPGDPNEEPLRLIDEEAKRCKQLVQDLLTFSRVGKTEKEKVDINEAVDSALSLVMTRTKVEDVRLEKELSGDLPRVFANRNQIQQVVVNLGNNAIDAMPKGGQITVRTKKILLEGKDAVEIQMIDTGEGIPPETQSKIFEPFFTSKAVGKGTGLGLSLVYEIIQKHNGTIRVESHVGKGTTFFLSLPVAHEEEHLSDR